MQNIATIARRQFRSYFNGASAYIVICLVLLVLGFFFWQTFFLMQRAQIRDMFRILSNVMVFAIPAMTMSLLAEEKRTGTIELLITMPVKDYEVIIGKFLGVLGLFVVLLLLTLPYPLSVSTLGNLDWGPVWTGYLGILFQGSAMIAVGLMASSFTENQLIAFFVACTILIPFVFLHWFLPLIPAGAASVIEWLSFDYHLGSLTRGVIDSRDLIFFASLEGFALAFAFRALESRRWQ